MAWIEDHFDERAGWRLDSREFGIEPFFDYHGCHLVVDGTDVECFPVWLPNNTALAGRQLPVRMSHGPVDSFGLRFPMGSLSGTVALVEIFTPDLQWDGHTNSSIANRATFGIHATLNRGAAGVIVINTLPWQHPWPVALNLGRLPHTRGVRPWPVPVVLVGSSARQRLSRAGPMRGGNHR